MERKFLLLPDGGFYTIEDLEKKLGYRHVSQNIFEEEFDVKKRGLKKARRKEVLKEALDRGKIYKKKIESSYIPQVSIRFVNNLIEYGLFAEETIGKGAYVGEYTGLVRKNNRRAIEPLNNYCYEYPVLDNIGRSFVIDATQGCLTRFINHSSTPNLKPHYAFFKGFYHAIFIAARHISVGEQLSFDYGTNYWYVRDAPQDLS